MCLLKKSIYFLLVCLIPSSSFAFTIDTHCPKEAIHCVFSKANHPAKWIKVTMLPRNISMVVCLSDQQVLYLEKDDIEQDGTLPGTILTWQFSQCDDEACLSSQPIGVDQFKLLCRQHRYVADPSMYRFNVNPNDGVTCTAIYLHA